MSKLLPILRTELRLDQTPTFIDGQAMYLLTDPLQNQYFRISKKTLAMLTHWDQLTAEQLVDKLNQKTDLDYSVEDVKSTLTFLLQNQLVITSTHEEVSAHYVKKNAKRTNLLKKLVHNYLFFKIPLFKPSRFIEKTAPYVNKLYSKTYLYILLIAFVIGFYLTIQQWYQFYQPLGQLLSLEGAIYLAIGMVIVKTVHELGHAYTANKFGCHVNSIGVAFLVLFPILYTDTSDAWRLKNSKHRLLIDLSGIMAEIQLIVWLMLFWNFIDSPIVKNIIVYAITVGLVSSLLINLNPLLRFDGYYALSNLLAIENLQPHGFALARWQLRKWLIGIQEAPPFKVSANKLKIMLIYSYITWIYRFFLFIGIAFLVYYLFFKALGIILFIIEIYYFILRPILSELSVYFSSIKGAKINRRLVGTLSILFIIIFMLVFPWRSTIIIPAVLTFDRKEDMYTQVDSFAEQMPFSNQGKVKRDSKVFISRSPDLYFQKQLTKIRINKIQTKLRIDRGRGLELGYKQTDVSELRALENHLQNIEEEETKLTRTAPYNGYIFNKSPTTTADRWYSSDKYLFSIATTSAWSISAYVPEYELGRISKIINPIFLSNNPITPPIPLAIRVMPLARVDILVNNPYLATTYGGQLPVYTKIEKEGELNLKESYYEFVFSPDKSLAKNVKFEQRGVVIMSVARQSFIVRIYKHIAALIVRESGF